MILKNASVVCEDFKLRRVDLLIENGKIAKIGEALNGKMCRSCSA